jgi:hypothetical protein
MKLSEHSAGARTKNKAKEPFRTAAVDGNKGIKQSPVRTEGDYETKSRELAAENEPKKKSGAGKIEKGFLISRPDTARDQSH